VARRKRREIKTDQQVRAASRRLSPTGVLPPVLALAALLLGLIAALGPADHPHARYSWPPHELPAAQPRTLWYTPLLLSRHIPQSLSVTVPCDPAPPLPGTPRPTLVLGTAREATATDSLAVVRRQRSLVVQLGGEKLVTAALPAAPAGACAYHLQLDPGRWSLDGGPGNMRRSGSLDRMPVVVGLFSGLDLRHGAAPTVEMTAVVHNARAKTYQAIFWVLSVLAALAALALVALTRGRRSRSSARRLLAHLGLPDLAVTALLLVWWFVGPAFFDDGWVAARQRNYSAAGGFSAYYTSFGVNLPLDYWVEWIEHWLVQSSSSLLVFRIPALVCLFATWALCRWLFARTTGSSANGPALWTLTCTFAVAALAWGMTFRPEPVLALLVTGILVCVVDFMERERAAPLALAAVLVVLSLSAHPAGIVAFAPLLAAAPAIVRWSRSNVRAVGSITIAATALLVVLVTVGSDLEQRRADITSLRTYGDETAGWREELTRYSFLSQSPYGTPLRRASVVLMLLGVLAFVLRRRRNGNNRLLDLPATALGLALVLLITTPTKWPWHFGALIGLAAVALAAEAARIRPTATEKRGWDVRPFLIVAAAIAGAAWAWSPRNAWGDLDLRTLHWTLGFESTLTLSKVGGALPLLFLIFLGLVEVARRGRRRLNEVPARAAPWMIVVIAVPLIAFTVAVLIRDTATTSSWTLGRQNLDSLRGRLHCGLGDDTLVAALGSMRAQSVIGSTKVAETAAWIPPAPARGVRGFALEPPPSRTTASRSAWFEVPGTRQLGFFLAGSPTESDRLELEWGREQGGKVVQIGADQVAGDASGDARPDLAYWRFYAAGDLPSPPPGANAVRFALRTTGIPGGPVGLTAPVTYENESLAAALQREAPALPLPNLLTYVPCVDLPRVGAVAQAPGSILAFRDSMWPVGTGTSPFDGLTDVYRIVRLPLSDSPDPPGEVALYEVDRHIDGGVVAPPVQRLPG
jgi:Mycobacterial cell wall arabinan synthesis protein